MSKAKMKARKAKRQQPQPPCPHKRHPGHAIFWATLAKNGKTTKIAECSADLAATCPVCRLAREAEKTGETVTGLHLLALDGRAVDAMTAAGDPSIAMLLALPEAPVTANFDTSPLIGETHRAAAAPLPLPNGWTVGTEIVGNWTTRAQFLDKLWATFHADAELESWTDGRGRLEPWTPSRPTPSMVASPEAEEYISHCAAVTAFPGGDVILLDVRQGWKMHDMRTADGRRVEMMLLHDLPQAAAEHMLKSEDQATAASARFLLDLLPAEPGTPLTLTVAGIERRVPAGTPPNHDTKLPNGWWVRTNRASPKEARTRKSIEEIRGAICTMRLTAAA